MRILFVNATRRWGGVKSWSLRVARGLRSRGHEVGFVLRPGNPFGEACRAEDFWVQEMAFGPDWNPIAILNLSRTIRNRRPDLIVTNVSKDNRIAGPAARQNKIPVLQRVGGPGDIRDRFSMRVEQRRYVTHIVTPAHTVVDHLKTFPWMHTEKRVTVVPNGVDLTAFLPGEGVGELRVAAEIKPDDPSPILVTTSQLTAIKGHDILMESLSKLAPQHRPYLVCIGEGKEQPRLESLARELNIASQVRFLGFHQHLGSLLEDATLVVQPSYKEGFPNSVVEAMAKGKAIVASDLPGIREAMETDVHGVLVPSGDANILARMIRDLLDNPTKREALGRAARERAESHFSETKMVSLVEALMERVVDTHGAES
ncbi:MAG: glycosyltransferase [Candidatus Eisenbacteria bacterium]|uniref:Glycosyltransferase n=1 Tax=Eiseniibacteriota bacterium TaxID=2212470 RepID=A0A7Y2EAF4_UNCEI|nr:glycosyltransferase [Candidatus Eisenbacteria bacterium]